MSIELRVARGAREGHRQTFDGDRVTLGRDARSDLRLDAERDLDASARHAEIVRAGEAWRLRDAGSTNGTFVNDERVTGERELRDGDLISLGRDGPRLEVRLGLRAASGPSPTRIGRQGTTERVEIAVRQRTSGLRLALVGALALVVIGSGAAFWMGRRDVAHRDAQLAMLLERHDSLGRHLERELDSMAGRLTGLDAALASAREESEALRAELERERSRASAESLERLATRLGAAESRQSAIATAARMDHAAIAAASGAAVALLAVEMPDGARWTGTGFAISRDGMLVTNRHVVRDSTGALAARVAVIFADTRRWLPARVVRTSDDAELALVAIDAPGPFPTVAGLATDASAPVVGAPVTVIGYPLGMDTPMSDPNSGFTARASLGVGTVSKVLPDLLQIDAWAGQGSSGSPVFEANGLVAAVVFGGARESNGRIVYAVPAAAIRRFVDGNQ